MEYTKRNFDIARAIIEILAKEKCTTAETADILNYVQKVVRESSVVQVNGIVDHLLSFQQ